MRSRKTERKRGGIVRSAGLRPAVWRASRPPIGPPGTAALPSGTSSRRIDMRYWFDGADEGFEREAERRSRLGLPPIPERPSLSYFLVLLLMALQAIPWIAIAVFVLMTVAGGH